MNEIVALFGRLESPYVRVRFNFPRLACFPPKTIRPHESADHERKERLRKKMGLGLANPVIVRLTKSGVPVLLDGTHRLEAAIDEGWRWILAQVVDEADVSLETWAHLTTTNSDDIRESLVRSGLLVLDAALPGATLAWVRNHSQTFAVSLGGERSPERWLAAMRTLVDAYHTPDRQPIQRGAFKHPRGAALELDRRHNSALVFAPVRYGLVEQLATDGATIPSGITRFVIASGRAIGVGMPIDLLMTGDVLSVQHWLNQKVRELPSIVAPGASVDEDNSWRRYDDALFAYDRSLSIARFLGS